MKAFALTTPDKPAELVELPEPTAPDDGVLVRVRAASVNGFDVFQAGGNLMSMMEHVLPTVIGRDFAGVIEAVGRSGPDFAVGDEVFGFVPGAPPLHDGTHAELLAAGPTVAIARKPAELSFEQAAAIPLAGATALDSVAAVDVGPGDTVLIAGASGGVGSMAVELAAQRGAKVIATAQAGAAEELVREMGASDVIDYTTGDVAAAIRERYPDGLTALIDTVNRDEDFARMAALVRDGGRVATTLGVADVEALASRNVRATNVMGDPTAEKLASLAGQVADGSLRCELQTTFPLSEVQETLASFTRGTRGKIVLAI